jgi:hypothetical protein
MVGRIFGKKPLISRKLGYKIGKVADVFGKKALGVIDVAAPIAAATMPQFAPAILAGQAAAHSADKAIRSGVATANPRAGESRAGNMIQFGTDLQSANRDQERLKKQTALLRQ